MEKVDYPGLPGIFLSVLFAGALSTLSSGISALAAITWKDLMEPFFPNLPEFRKTLITKGLSVFFGAAATAMAFAFKYVKGHVLELSLSLVTGSGGPITGMFLVGFFFPCVNAVGVSIGALLGLGVTMWLVIGQTFNKPYLSYLDTNVANCSLDVSEIKDIPTDTEDPFILYKISFMWFACIGTTITIIFSLLISAITGPMKGDTIDPRLMTPIVDYIIPCFPARIRKKFWCNVRYDEKDDFKDEATALDAINEKPGKFVPDEGNANAAYISEKQY